MIRYALICADCETGFLAWFASSAAYDAQVKANQLECPACEGRRIGKQIMAPAVRTSKQITKPPDTNATAKLFADARAHIAATHDYMGRDFPNEARAMHYGEIEDRPIWGETSPEEAKALHEEGISAVPLPAQLTPKLPREHKKLN